MASSGHQKSCSHSRAIKSYLVLITQNLKFLSRYHRIVLIWADDNNDKNTSLDSENFHRWHTMALHGSIASWPPMELSAVIRGYWWPMEAPCMAQVSFHCLSLYFSLSFIFLIYILSYTKYFLNLFDQIVILNL